MDIPLAVNDDNLSNNRTSLAQRSKYLKKEKMRSLALFLFLSFCSFLFFLFAKFFFILALLSVRQCNL